jgi:hypothetical protein
MFEPHLRALREQGYTHVISHEAREQENYAQRNFKGNVDSTMETMQMPQIVADPDQLKTSGGQALPGQHRRGEAEVRNGRQQGSDRVRHRPVLQTAALGGMQAALYASRTGRRPEDRVERLRRARASTCSRTIRSRSAGWSRR